MSRTSFLKTSAVLWAGGLFGAIAVVPFALSLQRETLSEVIAQTGLPLSALIAISILQGALFLAVAVAVGLWAARKIGLGAPLVEALLARVPLPMWTGSALRQAALVGVVCGGVIIALEVWIFRRLDPAGIGAIEGAQPPAWQGLLASFYGGIAEELQLRLFLLSLVALGLRTLGRLMGADRKVLLPGWVFWGANIVSAVVFGLAHLPATAALVTLTPLIVARAVLLNGIAAIPFGWLFRRHGIESAMAAHFMTDIVLHVVVPLVTGVAS